MKAYEMKRTLTLAVLAASLLTTCGEPSPQHYTNHTNATRGFDTVRRVQLPLGHAVFVLRDVVSGTCLLMTKTYGGMTIQIVPDSMCGA